MAVVEAVAEIVSDILYLARSGGVGFLVCIGGVSVSTRGDMVERKRSRQLFLQCSDILSPQPFPT